MSERPPEAPCARLCAACGRLDDPAPAGTYRLDPRHTALDRCPHCGEAELLDLRSADVIVALAEALSEGRAQRRPLGPRLLRRVVLVGATTLAAVVVALLLVMLALSTGKGRQVGAILAGMVGLLFGVPALVLAGRAIRRQWQRTAARPLPARWRLHLPAGGAPAAIVEGPLAIDGPPLTAPISGRPCVAFEIGLREDGDADGPLGSWLLLEQRSAPLRVGDHEVAGDGAHLEIPRQPVAWPLPGPDRDRAACFLRARGFSDGELDGLRVFEAVIEAGEVVAFVAGVPPTLRARGPHPPRLRINSSLSSCSR